jgi:tRNA/tmRNA/rRNA uracil-C5-methylase (TrmA/RlmC/RlmD family)
LRAKDNHVVKIQRCEIASENVNRLLNEIHNLGNLDYFDVIKKTGTFRYAVIRAANDNSSVSFVLNQDSKRLQEAVALIEKFSREAKADNVLITYVPPNIEESTSDDYFVVKGNDSLHESYLNRNFAFSAQGFLQNNHEVAEAMYSYCHGLLASCNPHQAHLLDLYGGIGVFGIINAGLFSSVAIIENSAQSIKAANINIKENKIDNAQAILLDAKNLRRLSLSSPLFVITDPPRTGMDMQTLHHLIKLKPRLIIYVSCNLHQLKKDLAKLKGYNIKSAALFDMFPQTNHLESVIELTPE